MKEAKQNTPNKIIGHAVLLFFGSSIAILIIESLVAYFVEKAFSFGKLSFMAALSSALLIALVKMMFDIIRTLNEQRIIEQQHHQTTQEAIKQHYTNKHTEVVRIIETTNDRIVRMIRIDRKFYDDQYFLQQLEDLAHSKENINKMPHIVRKYMEGIMKESVAYIKSVSEGAEVALNSESDRVTKINEVMEDSEQKVLAVTYDADNYLMEFWNTQDRDKYLELNKKIAEKSKVNRIFVVDDKTLSDNAKRDLLKSICENLSGVDNIKTKVIKAEAAKTLRAETTSFIVIDDAIASESTTGVGNLRGQKYMSFGNKDIVNKLTLRFKAFDSIKGENL